MGGLGKKEPMKERKKPTDWLTEGLTSWSRVILGNFIFQHLFKKFSVFYWPRSIQSTPFRFVTLIPLEYFRPLSDRLFSAISSSGFSSEIVHAFLFLTTHATCSAHIILLDLIA